MLSLETASILIATVVVFLINHTSKGTEKPGTQLKLGVVGEAFSTRKGFESFRVDPKRCQFPVLVAQLVEPLLAFGGGTI